MKITYKKAAIELHSWLKTIQLTEGLSELINVLALIRVCTITDDVIKDDFNKIAKQFLEEAPEIDYTKSDLLTTLLACDLVQEIGNSLQVKSAKRYLLLLKELWEEGIYKTNTDILKVIFTEIKYNESCKITVRMDRFNKNISNEVVKTLKRIERKSSYGLIQVDSDYFSVLKVESMAIRAQREYDIPLAMRCLRARNYLDFSDSLLMRTSMSFIESQQCYDGSFGDYDADVLQISNINERKLALFKIKTIVSFQIMWLLLELNQVNLLSSLHFLQRTIRETSNV